MSGARATVLSSHRCSGRRSSSGDRLATVHSSSTSARHTMVSSFASAPACQVRKLRSTALSRKAQSGEPPLKWELASWHSSACSASKGR